MSGTPGGPVRAIAIVLALTGAAAAGYGVWLLLDLGRDNLLATLLWLAGGVVVHDGVLAPAVVLAGLALTRILARSGRGLGAPTVWGLVVLGTVTVTAVPVLSGLGVRADNPTLLDRPYLTGWLVLAGITWGLVAAVSVLRRGRSAGDSGSARRRRG